MSMAVSSGMHSSRADAGKRMEVIAVLRRASVPPVSSREGHGQQQ